MNRQMKFEDYDGFVEKFKPKKTTDDCMTPPEIYEVVKEYACRRWGIDPEKVVRPFWPGGDYEKFDYSGGKVVIDNHPFSILTKICTTYLDEGIPFFLFAPSLTALSSKRILHKMNHIICDCDIIYENGAVVRTSFVTSYGLPNILESSPELTRLVNDRMNRLLKERKKDLPKYQYPNEVVTAAMVQRYSKYGVNFCVASDEAVHIGTLDEQRGRGKSIYGGGLLLSEQAAAERAAAERAAAERAAAERMAAATMCTIWKLSEREKEIVQRLSRRSNKKALAYTE